MGNSVQNFYTSRDNNTDPATYVGQLDRLWYNPTTNSIFVSDGVTPGGQPVALATGANITANIITVNTLTATSGTIDVLGNLDISGNISPAANGKIGGITPGPGVFISNQGELTIDSANLPINFGNFTASNNILSIVNVDEDMILQTEGDAEIQLIGNIGFYKPDGIPPDVANRYAFFNNDGQVTFYIPVQDLTGAVNFIGSTTGNFISPGLTGAMLHVTGQFDVPCRLYYDGNGDYVSWVARRWNGNVASPTQVLAGEDVLRINATAATNLGGGNVPSQAIAQLFMQALENQTPTAQGSKMGFIVTPVGEPTANRIEVANITVANGVTATKFTTAGTVTATGNISGGNLILSTGGLISSSGLISTTANISAGNISTTGRADITGNLAAGNISTAGAVAVTGNVTAGNVNSYVTLPAGTTSKGPLIFTSGTLQTVPTTGAMNYDGRVFYATPQSTERGLIVTEQVYIPNADYTLLNQTAVQSLFGVSVSLSSGTRYAYRLLSTIYKTANNISLQYATDGNVVLAKHSYQTTTTASASLATVSTPGVLRNILTTGFDTPVTVSSAFNGTGYYSLTINGTLNVTTGGTWNPLVGFTGLPGVGSYLAAGSSIEIWPIGPTGANVSIGAWS